VPHKTVQQLYNIADGGFEANGWWYYFLRVYDIINREIGTFGPLPVWVDPAKPLPQ
jgi:hypothetical protein